MATYVELSPAELEELIADGDCTAMNVLARKYERGDDGLEQSYEKAIELYRKGAELNNPSSQYYLAEAYEEGHRIEQNNELAFYWYNKAANLDDIEAMINVANRYFLGKGCDSDIGECNKWIDKVASLSFEDLNHVIANNKLQGIASLEMGAFELAVEHFEIALAWIEKAKRYNSNTYEIREKEISLHYNIGRSYFALDKIQEAQSHFKKAQQLGEIRATVYLAFFRKRDAQESGVNLSTLYDVIPTLERAIESIEECEQLNNDDRKLLAWAYFQLGIAYGSGVGTKFNENKAGECCKIAADLGSEAAKEMVSRFRRTRKGYEFVG